MQVNGTTAWMADPETGDPKRIFCVETITPPNIQRSTDDDRCLEDKGRKGARAGTELTASDITMTAEFEEQNEDQRCACQWITKGRDLLPGETFSDGFETQLAIAFCNGCVFYYTVWVQQIGLDQLNADEKVKWSITFTTISCWCDGKANWETGDFPEGYDDWSAAIAAYYESVSPSNAPVGFQARRSALRAPKSSVQSVAKPKEAKTL